MRVLRRASKYVAIMQDGELRPAEYRQLMLERVTIWERGFRGVLSNMGFAKVCAKVVAEGGFEDGLVDAEDVECELGGLVMTEFLREATTHGWIIEAIN